MNRKTGFIRPEQHNFFMSFIPEHLQAHLAEESYLLLGAVENDTPVGALVLKTDDLSARICSVYVLPENRRQGIATSLISAAIRMLRRSNVQELYTVICDPEEPVTALLTRIGMEQTECNSVYSTTVGHLSSVAALKRQEEKSVSLEALPNNQFLVMARDIFGENPQAVDRKLYDPDLSRAYMENGLVSSLLLMRYTDGALTISWFEDRSSNQMVPMYLLRDACAEALKKYAPETPIEFTCLADSSAKLSEALLGEGAEKRTMEVYELPSFRFRLFDLGPATWEADGQKTGEDM